MSNPTLPAASAGRSLVPGARGLGALPVARRGRASSASRSSSRWTPARSAAAGKARVRADGGEVTGDLPIINGFAAKLPADAADALERRRGVQAVTRNAAVEPQGVSARRSQTAYPASVNAPQAWNTPDADVTGKGVGVAVIDTGIAGQHARLPRRGLRARSRVVASAVTNPDATQRRATPSATARTSPASSPATAANRAYSDPLQGRYVGIAPEANLISVKVSDDHGNATVLDVIYGLQFVVDHKAAYNIRVVNLSLESTTPGSYKTDPLNAAVEAAWFKGIVVVAAAGNRGSARRRGLLRARATTRT